ncbi:hypothetical protein [Zhihengliuella flava]|uniref:Uncharacterized protein n=1 Tax=Zhihengliuella flava TaxID=1285193 RepID=A0A931GEK8_9MICC|nr:hypothetical protein [Zhihengliuella flava]MBG6084513.1 hypothetical protein [Zhihengliuella flava]
MRQRRARWHRAVAAAALSTVATACAHQLGGGEFPHVWLLAASFALAIPLCWALGGRRATGLTVAMAVTAAEIVQHVIYSLQAAQAIHAHGHLMLFMHLVAGAGTFAWLRATEHTQRRILDALIIGAGVRLSTSWHAVRRAVSAARVLLARCCEALLTGSHAAGLRAAANALHSGSLAHRRAAHGTTAEHLNRLVLSAPVIRRGPPAFS